MELTKENFKDFVERLFIDQKGDHITADPIFTVQKLNRTYGFDSEYQDEWVIVVDESEFDSMKEVVENLEAVAEEEMETLLELTECETKEDFLKLDSWNQMDALNDNRVSPCVEYRKVYYKEDWVHVNSHFTKEAAEAFIQRKKHDYKELRVYVEAQVHCWEYNAIIKGLVNGDIVLKETE